MIQKAKEVLARTFLVVEKHNKESLTSARKAACFGCVNYDAENDQCLACGCIIKIKTELLTNRNPRAMGRIEETHCPLGNWGDTALANKYRELDGKTLLEN